VPLEATLNDLKTMSKNTISILNTFYAHFSESLRNYIVMKYDASIVTEIRKMTFSA
jgi:hypothetical protein